MLHIHIKLKVQHNLQPRSLRIFLFWSKYCPFFLGWSFQIRFSVAVYFWYPFFHFFWWQPTLAPVLLSLYYLAFLKLFFGWPRFFLMLSCIARFLITAFKCLIILTFWDVIAFCICLFKKLRVDCSWCFMILSIGLWFEGLLGGFDFLGLWFHWLSLVDAILFLLEVYGVVVRSFLLLVL